ncbi:MAG: hypothetical protein IPQ07_18075 [Myxococcales bacterium]|nr:hypothetical protein [Myxococcales bacterium]
MHHLRIVTVVLLVTLTSIAGAGKAKPIKAEFLCGTYVGGTIKEAITGGKRGKLTDPVVCAIHVADPNEPSHMGNIHTVRYAVDPATGKKSKVVTSGKTDDFGGQSEADKKDFTLILTPNANDANGEVPWKPCEDFDLVATVSDDLGVYFTKTIKVVQACPKPAPIKARLSCNYEAQDGTMIKWPGNGDKLKARLSSGKGIDCNVVVPKDPPSGVTLTASGKIKGKKAKPVTEVAGPMPPSGIGAGLSFYPAEDTFSECENFAIEFALTDQDGAVRWAATQKFVQECGD